MPINHTMGPKLCAWMDEYLIKPLQEKNWSHTATPSREIAEELSRAHLRGKGSVRTVVKFFAVPGSLSRYTTSSASTTGRREEREMRAELRSLVGRMVWMETWCRFIKDTKFWWQDEEIAKECRECETEWEYILIEGVKEELQAGSLRQIPRSETASQGLAFWDPDAKLS